MKTDLAISVLALSVLAFCASPQITGIGSQVPGSAICYHKQIEHQCTPLPRCELIKTRHYSIQSVSHQFTDPVLVSNCSTIGNSNTPPISCDNFSDWTATQCVENPNGGWHNPGGVE